MTALQPRFACRGAEKEYGTLLRCLFLNGGLGHAPLRSSHPWPRSTRTGTHMVMWRVG
jgi:hypothetical protein